MSLTIHGFNIVLKRESLDRVITGGSESFIRRVREPRHNAAFVTNDDHLVAVRFTASFLLEALVKNLLCHRLQMSVDGMFADFAIVHAEHGLTMPCNWLEHERIDGRAIVWLKGKEREPPFFVPSDLDIEPLDSKVLADSAGGIESRWITQVGPGFLLSRDGGFHAWLDFNTGRIIVSYLPEAAATIE